VVRRAWLAGRVAALLAIVVAGTLAIVHYSSLSPAPAYGPARPAVAAAPSTASAVVSRPAAARPNLTAPPVSQPAPTREAVVPERTPSASPRVPSPSPTPPGSTSQGTAPIHFRTLPPNAVLPTGAECARWVRESSQPEIRPANKADNETTGQRVGPHFFPAGDSPQAAVRLAPRINGDFTGSTEQILRWAACKWGIDQDVVFAQAAVESWWQQDALGDWGTTAAACPPGHQPGADGRAGECPRSYGILQDRYAGETGGWPGIADSTAMNADAAYATWRSCYDGYEVWLDNVPHGRPYRPGDLWGCVGRWDAGHWHTAAAQRYIARVKAYLHERIWLTRQFTQDS
jgi:autotransporter family porin